MTLDQLKAAQGGQTLWDKGEAGSVKGLHARVLPNGTKVFFLYYRTREGKQRRPKIGTLGEITLSEARKRARSLQDRVAIGEDPKAEWDSARGEPTVQELWEKAWAGHWNVPRYQKSEWAQNVSYLYDKHLKPRFGSMRLSEMTPNAIRQWHAGFEKKPYAGNRSLNVLSRMFQYAEEQELRPQNTNPCHLVKAFPERKRERYASVAEIQKIAPLLEREAKKYPNATAFLYLLMFSGSRPRAIERATWDQIKEFDVDGQPYGLLTFEGKTTAKTGQQEKVILPPQAMRVISKLERIEGQTITGLQMPRKLWDRIKKEAGCPDLWARDWRRTFATVGMSEGLGMDGIGELLNHKDRQTTMRYAKLMQGARVDMAAAIAKRMEELLVTKETR